MRSHRALFISESTSRSGKSHQEIGSPAVATFRGSPGAARTPRKKQYGDRDDRTADTRATAIRAPTWAGSPRLPRATCTWFSLYGGGELPRSAAAQRSWLLRIRGCRSTAEVAGSATAILRTCKSSVRMDGASFASEIAPQFMRRIGELEGSVASPSSVPAVACNWSMRAAIPALAALALGVGLPTATRLRSSRALLFSDRIQGTYRQGPWRPPWAISFSSGVIHVFAYLLAVVVDDAEQGGDPCRARRRSTGQHAAPDLFAAAVGLPSPPMRTSRTDRTRRHHLPSRGAACVWIKRGSAAAFWRSLHARLRVPSALRAATVADAWEWAIAHFTIGQVPRRLNVRVTD